MCVIDYIMHSTNKKNMTMDRETLINSFAQIKADADLLASLDEELSQLASSEAKDVWDFSKFGISVNHIIKWSNTYVVSRLQ